MEYHGSILFIFLYITGAEIEVRVLHKPGKWLTPELCPCHPSLCKKKFFLR